MLIDESRRRQAELEKSIYEMAKEPLEDAELRKQAIKFKSIYTSNFRHNYSGFYPLILDIAKDDNGYNLEYLSNNIEQLRLLVEKDYVNGEKEFKGLYMPLSKLSDHLNLEVARYNYYAVSQEEMKDIVKKNQDMQKTLSDAQDALSDAKERAANMQTEYTTILGIFAAIVLAFTGTITFSSSVLENIHQASIYRLLLIILTIGFVAINIVWLLMDFIVKINAKRLSEQKDTPSNNSRKGFFIKYWKIFAINIIIILGIIFTCISYKYNWFNTEQKMTQYIQQQR